MSSYLTYPTSEQEEILKNFLVSHDIPFEEQDEVLPAHVLEGIKRGQEDFEAGRFITYEEFKKKMKSQQG